MDQDETLTAPEAEPAAQALGQFADYRLVRVLGQGGMGTVYEAQQDRPHRAVALKVIRPGIASAELLRRFDMEAEVLGRLHHPGIAQVYEAGTGDTGSGSQPFFAMELIEGRSLLRYADENELDTRARIEVMIEICDAVHHAHQKGVIHRDLKPSNILVDGAGRPKILDFGVARVTDSDMRATVQTSVGQIVGTLPYMSPEQVAGDPLELDTRSDVYALGVVLYELLSGRPPQDLRDRALVEAARIIQEEEPEPLSSVDRSLRGDPETIVAKALRKQKESRYQSVAELQADLVRYLQDEPISAKPPSTVYQLRKFARRNRALVVGVVAVLVTLTGGVIASWNFALREASQRREAEQARVEAEQARAEAEHVSDFLVELFEVSDPGEARGNSITARELLDQGAARIAGMLTEQPETRAALMTTMGEVYRNVGLYAQAEPLLLEALETQKRVLGDDHADTLGSINKLGAVYVKQGRYDEAEALLLENLETRQRVLGDDNPATLTSMNNLAVLYKSRGRYDQAETLYYEAVENQKRILGDDHPDTLRSMNNLAELYRFQGRYDEAAPLYLQALETHETILGDDHPATLRSMSNLASLYRAQGRLDEAEPLYLEALETRKRVLGGDHPDTLRSMNNLANVYRIQGRYDEATPLYLEALQTHRRVLGDEHKDTLAIMNNLAELYRTQAHYDEAEALYLEALETQKRVLGDDHPDSGITIHNLGCLYRETGRLDESRRRFERAQQIWEARLGPDHPYIAENLAQWSALLREIGDDTGADRVEARAKAIRKK